MIEYELNHRERNMIRIIFSICLIATIIFTNTQNQQIDKTPHFLQQMENIIRNKPAGYIDWWGYYKVPDIQTEGPVHAFVRGFVNIVPSTIINSAKFVSVTYAQTAIWFGNTIRNKNIVDYGNDLEIKTSETTDDFLEKMTWQYGPKGIGDRDANKFFYILGQIAFLILFLFMPFISNKITDTHNKIIDSSNKRKTNKENYKIYLRNCDKFGKAPLTYKQWKFAYSSKNDNQKD